jgi:hypothetical protein
LFIFKGKFKLRIHERYGAFSMKDTSKFLSEEEVRNKIEKLKSGDWPKYNTTDNLDNYIEQVSKLLTEEFNTLPDVVEFLKTSEFGFKLFRV